MAQVGLFASPKATLQSKPKFVDLGGQGDCGFRAVAAGFIDHVYAQSRFDHQVLEHCLEQFYTYFPSCQTLTPRHQLPNLAMPELLDQMTYVFRQMAVDEMCKDPARYQEAFGEMKEGTSPEKMRQTVTWIDEAAIAALAEALGISIRVSLKALHKELPSGLVYKKTAKSPANPEVVIQLLNGHYMPKLNHAHRFDEVKRRQPHPMTPVMKKVNDPDMATILSMIEKDNQAMLRQYQETLNSLQWAVRDHALNKEQLLDLYISGMKTSDYLEGRVKQVRFEYASQSTFDALQAQQGNEVQEPVLAQDESIVRELVHALARAVSIGQMDEEELFSTLDEKMPARMKAV